MCLSNPECSIRFIYIIVNILRASPLRICEVIFACKDPIKNDMPKVNKAHRTMQEICTMTTTL